MYMFGSTLIVNWKLFEMGVVNHAEGFKLAGKRLKSSKQSLPGTANNTHNERRDLFKKCS